MHLLLLTLLTFSTPVDLLVSGNPYGWKMTCDQSEEAIETLYEDEFFSRPENHPQRDLIKKKLLRHTPEECKWV